MGISLNETCKVMSFCRKWEATSIQWLGKINMHMYAKCDPNIPCGLRVMNISLISNGRMDRHTDGQTHIVITVQTQGSFNFSYFCLVKATPLQ